MHSPDLELTLPAFLFQRFMEIKKNASLEKYTTMRLPGSADYFVEVKNKEELMEAVSFSKKNDLPFFILGAGSNTLFPQRYEGLVIKMEMKEVSLQEEGEEIVVRAGAGVSLVWLSRKITEMGGVGMEWGTGVPGSVGGAVRGNAGSFGNCMADFVTKVHTLEKTFSSEECLFGYRESVFKKKEDFIITEVEMRVPKGEGGEEKIEQLLSLRKEKQPHQPSAGSVFKNIEDMPVASLIEQCGLKGERRGGAQISEKHANFIVNTGGATREDVDYLIDLIKRKVKEKFDLEIEEEVDRIKK